MKIICLIYLLVLFVISVGLSKGQAPSSRDCDVKVEGGKYKSAGIDALLNSPSSYFGFILVRPKDVKKEFFVKLLERLKAEYCHADQLQVVIFDKKKYANGNSLRDYTESKGKTILMRGFYKFDRGTGIDLLDFSNKLGNPTTEVQIDFMKN